MAILPIAVVAAITYAVAPGGAFDPEASAIFVSGSIAGAVLGARVNARVRSARCACSWRVLTLVFGLRLVIPLGFGAGKEDLPLDALHVVLLVYLGVQGGFLAGLLGVGGGAIAIAVFAAIGVDQVLAQGIAITATIPHRHGRRAPARPPGHAGAAPGLLAGLVGMLFAIPGALMAFAVPVEVLRTGFGVFLLLGSYRMFRALRRAAEPRWRNRLRTSGYPCRPTVNKEPTMSDAPREKTFLLARPEARVLDWLAARLPARVMPDHMTALGVARGARDRRRLLADRARPGLAVGRRAACSSCTGSATRSTARSPACAGSSGRRYGYYLDHLVDAVATVADRHRARASPYMLLATGLAIVVAYLVLSINTYLETQAFGVFSLGYGRVGPTEARVGLIAAQPRAAGRGDGRPRHRRPRVAGSMLPRSASAPRATCACWPSASPRAWCARRITAAVLTDYHVHLRPDDDGTPAAELLHGGQRRALPRGGGGAGDHRARRRRAHPPLHRSRSTSGSTRGGRSGRATTSTPTARFVREETDLRLGIEADFVAGPRGPASRTCSTRASGTTSSARCTSSRDEAVDMDDCERLGPRRVGREGLEALLRDGRPRRRAPGCSTSWPTPTW